MKKVFISLAIVGFLLLEIKAADISPWNRSPALGGNSVAPVLPSDSSYNDGSKLLEQAENAFKNEMYLTAKEKATKAKKIFNKDFDNSYNTASVEKNKVRLGQVEDLLSKIDGKIHYYDSINIDREDNTNFFPYYEVMKDRKGCNVDNIAEAEEDMKKLEEEITPEKFEKLTRQFKSGRSYNNGSCVQQEAFYRLGQYQYSQALKQLERNNITGAKESMDQIHYYFENPYKLIYNLSRLNYSMGKNSLAESFLNDIYRNANIVEGFGGRTSRYPEVTKKADALYEKIKLDREDQEKQTEERKAEEKKEELITTSKKDPMTKEEMEAYTGLGEKAKILESLIPIFEKKDQEIQRKVKAVVEGFKLSTDNYTRNIGFYFSYLIR